MQPRFLAIVLAAAGCGRVGHVTHPGADGGADGGQDGGRDASGDVGHNAAVAADIGAPPPDAGTDACSGSGCRMADSCQTGITSIAGMPAGTTTLDFER